MARSKAPLFDVDEQLASKLCHGMAHPARVRMISRLMDGRKVNYATLLSGIPLNQKSCMQHLNILTRLGFIQPALLHTKRGGYQLNAELYLQCTAATRRVLRTGGHLRSLGGGMGEEVV